MRTTASACGAWPERTWEASSRGVSAQRHITGPMQPIFDVPMSAHPLQDLSHQGVGRQTATK
jgi:hypothetical protein